MPYHVKNADLRNEIIRCKETGILSKIALDMLILMTKKFSTKYKYAYEQDKEECIAIAIMDCYQYWRGYDPAKSQNAFAYFTQIIKNGFMKAWRKLYGNFPISKRISISTYSVYNL